MITMVTTKTMKMMSAMMIIFNICLIFFLFIYFTVSNDKGRPIFSTLKLTHPISLCKNYPDIPIFLQVNSSPHTISTILIITIFKKIIISLYFKTVYQLTKLLPFFYHWLQYHHHPERNFYNGFHIFNLSFKFD